MRQKFEIQIIFLLNIWYNVLIIILYSEVLLLDKYIFEKLTNKNEEKFKALEELYNWMKERFYKKIFFKFPLEDKCNTENNSESLLTDVFIEFLAKVEKGKFVYKNEGSLYKYINKIINWRFLDSLEEFVYKISENEIEKLKINISKLNEIIKKLNEINPVDLEENRSLLIEKLLKQLDLLDFKEEDINLILEGLKNTLIKSIAELPEDYEKSLDSLKILNFTKEDLKQKGFKDNFYIKIILKHSYILNAKISLDESLSNDSDSCTFKDTISNGISSEEIFMQKEEIKEEIKNIQEKKFAFWYRVLQESIHHIKKGKLKETIPKIIEYYQIKLTNTLPADLSIKTIDELICNSNPFKFRFSQKELYQYLREELNINRSTLYSRINDIKQEDPILGKVLEDMTDFEL